MRHAFGQDFDLEPGYLNTASIGVPPVTVADAVAGAVERWRTGRARPAEFDDPVAAARAGFARLVGAEPDRVAIGSTVSQLAGIVAASVPDGARVLVPRGEFTSVTFPFAAQQARGVKVSEVDFSMLAGADLADHVAGHDVVATSVVQSADGRIADLGAVRRAADRTGARVLLDATQAAGWLPLELGWADWVVAGSYKWLMSPRGAAWLAVREDRLAELMPHAANWYAGEDPWQAIYGLPLRLATSARRLDLSPVWLAHVGAATALPWLAELDMAAVRDHCTGLADTLFAGLGLPRPGSAIVSLDLPGAGDALATAGVAASSRAGRTRLAFHLYNTVEDVDRALSVLRPLAR